MICLAKMCIFHSIKITLRLKVHLFSKPQFFMLNISYVRGWPAQWLEIGEREKKKCTFFFGREQKISCQEAQQSVVNNTGRNGSEMLVCAPGIFFCSSARCQTRHVGSRQLILISWQGGLETPHFLHAHVQVLVVCVRISQWLYQTLNLIHFLIISKTGREKPSVGLARQKSHYNARN